MFVRHQAMFRQLPEDLVTTGALQTGNRRYQFSWNYFVILHTHFNLKGGRGTC